MTAADRDREAFEAWMREEHPHCNLAGLPGGEYVWMVARFQWKAWQAARAQAGEHIEPVIVARQGGPEAPGNLPMLEMASLSEDGQRFTGKLDIVDGQIVYEGDMPLAQFRELFDTAWRPHVGLTLTSPAQASEPVAPGEYRLPCDVHLPPNTYIRKGCALETLLFSLKRREGFPDDATTFPKPESGESVHTHPAQEPVAVPAWMAADEAWQDLCEKDDRTSIDYPGFALIRQDELAGYMAAAPISPPAESGEAESAIQEIERLVYGGQHNGAASLARAVKVIRAALASTPAPQPDAVCPTCSGNGRIGGMVRFGDGEVDGIEEPCPMCYGKGYHQEWLEDGAGAPFTDCNSCGGTGKVDAAPQPGGAVSDAWREAGEKQLQVHEALRDSAYRAGARAGWNAQFAADPDAAIEQLTRYPKGSLAIIHEKHAYEMGSSDTPAQQPGWACPHCSGTGHRQDKKTGKSYPCPRCEPTEQPGGAAFGIIDPDYARVFTQARAIAWQEGYAIMMHGSFTRDLDLLAVPWTDAASEPEHLVRRIETATKLKNISRKPGKKPHGRIAWTLTFPTFGDPRFVDLGIMPRALEPSPSQSDARAEAKVREALEWYAEQVAGCRKLGNIGDPARHELDRDGGKRAREALGALPFPTPAGDGQL